MAHYVNNKKLYETLVEYKDKIKVCESEGKQLPRIPEYVGECIWQIANRLSTKPNFVNYTYRDEMISDGIENCVMVIKNFDPNKSQNPFAYFTQIIYYAFIRRIQKEKKQTYIKHKSLENFAINEALFDTQDGDASSFSTNSAEGLNSEYMSDFVQSFEDGLKKKREKANEQ
jgi:hypothetical protein